MPPGVLAVREVGQELRRHDQDGSYSKVSAISLQITVFRQSQAASQLCAPGTSCVPVVRPAPLLRPKLTGRPTSSMVGPWIATARKGDTGTAQIAARICSKDARQRTWARSKYV